VISFHLSCQNFGYRVASGFPYLWEFSDAPLSFLIFVICATLLFIFVILGGVQLLVYFSPLLFWF
jgi:hypothetical protein